MAKQLEFPFDDKDRRDELLDPLDFIDPDDGEWWAEMYDAARKEKSRGHVRHRPDPVS